jgi:hypothetical protein
MLEVEKGSPSNADLQQPPVKQSFTSAAGWTFFFFVASWLVLYGLFRGLPYLRNGSDVVFSAKLRFEETGQVFPADPHVTRVLIFGNSKILAGFLAARFDQLSTENHDRVSSFNSGFPGSDLLLPPLKTLCERGQAPNVLLLTLPWDPDPPPAGIFHFIPDDHAVIERLFPFRNFLRDLTAFLLNARSHGGIQRYYQESKDNEHAVIAERGYHLITEQSHFPGGRLPEDFRLDSDQPLERRPREAPPANSQSEQLKNLISRYRITCYYVPIYLRQGEAAPASPFNQAFAAQLERATSCRLLGPDYYLYPNRFFADQTHLNEDGARLYTEALFALLKESGHALQ